MKRSKEMRYDMNQIMINKEETNAKEYGKHSKKGSSKKDKKKKRGIFKKVLIKNKFPQMRFHDLRHSCASILYDKGRRLGHADI